VVDGRIGKTVVDSQSIFITPEQNEMEFNVRVFDTSFRSGRSFHQANHHLALCTRTELEFPQRHLPMKVPPCPRI
jgi:hypothetical protein